MSKLLIICPAFNEGEKLPTLIEEFKSTSHFKNLLVINSGSSDNTKNILKKNNIKSIDLPVNKGVGFALISGIKYAIEKNYDICCVIAGNGKMDPKEIDKIVHKVKNEDYDFVQGSRYLDATK